MPLPVIANTYRTSLNWAQPASGQSAVNVMHFRGSTGDETDLFEALEANVDGVMWNFTSSDAAVSTVEIIKLDGNSATQEFPTVAAGWSGDQTAGDCAFQVAELVSFRTGVRGPAGRGRIYIPFITESSTGDGGIASPAGLANQQAAWQTFATAMSASGFPLVVASYVNAAAADVTTIVCETLLGTQRRRQDRRRRE